MTTSIRVVIAVAAAAISLHEIGWIATASAADGQRTRDFSVRYDLRRNGSDSYRANYRPQPRYYARPYYYRPYPYASPAPFTFGFNFGPGF